MATTHIDYRKIDYDQLIDKPITRVASGVNPNTLTTAGVYDRGDGNRFIVTVDGQNITQVIEEKDGYQTRSSTDGGTTWTTWDEIEFSKSGDIDAEDVNYDNTDSGLTATDVQAAIDEIDTSVDTINTTITNIQTDITEIKDIVEVETMPTPSEESEGTIIQYKGATTSTFTHGYFYECVGDGQDPATYSWVRIDVQPSGAGDDHEFITLTAYNQLTPTQKAEKVYMITEDGVPGSGLTAGAGIDITNNVISADMATAVYDNTTSGATATNVQDAIDEVFQSVSNGKTLIAAAITDKGVQTAASDSFQTMAENIAMLPSRSVITDSLFKITTDSYSHTSDKDRRRMESVFFDWDYSFNDEAYVAIRIYLSNSGTSSNNRFADEEIFYKRPGAAWETYMVGSDNFGRIGDFCLLKKGEEFKTLFYCGTTPNASTTSNTFVFECTINKNEITRKSIYESYRRESATIGKTEYNNKLNTLLSDGWEDVSSMPGLGRATYSQTNGAGTLYYTTITVSH